MSAEPMTWEIRSYLEGSEADGDHTEWAVDDAEGREICFGIQTRELAEDIAALPLLKMLAAARVPIQTANSGPLASSANTLIEILRVLQHIQSNQADARGDSVSSVAIEDMAKGDPKVVSKNYATSPLTKEDVDNVLALHGYAHREAARRALDGWSETAEAIRNGGVK